MEAEKNKGGRPRLEKTLKAGWEEIMIQSGKEGKHITDFITKMGISREGHYAILARNKQYSDTYKEYQLHCEQWWFNKAHESIVNGESNKFNQRLWTIIMKTKFKNSGWTDEKQIDITSQGDKLSNPNAIQVEIIRAETKD